jgi:hypothetical protein
MKPTFDVLWEVGHERKRQNERFAEQNHPLGHWIIILGEEFGEVCRAAYEAVNALAVHGPVGYEAELRAARQELVQVAAVAVAMIESLDRNELKGAN